MESQNVSWLEAMYEAMFLRGEKTLKIVWANPASKKKMLFLTANARQGMMNGFSEVHNVPENGKKILHIHLFHMRDRGVFLYWDNIDKTYYAFLYKWRALAEMLQKRTDLVSIEVPLTSSQGWGNFTLKFLGCRLDCFQICSFLWNFSFNNEMNIVKSQLQQCSNTATSKWVDVNDRHFSTEGLILCARNHLCKQGITHHFSMGVEELHCMKYLTIHLDEQTSYIFQQNTRQKHTEDVFIAKILPQGK